MLSAFVRAHSYAQISESVLFHNVVVVRHCRIRRAIIDKGVELPEGHRVAVLSKGAVV